MENQRIWIAIALVLIAALVGLELSGIFNVVPDGETAPSRLTIPSSPDVDNPAIVSFIFLTGSRAIPNLRTTTKFRK